MATSRGHARPTAALGNACVRTPSRDAQLDNDGLLDVVFMLDSSYGYFSINQGGGTFELTGTQINGVEGHQV